MKRPSAIWWTLACAGVLAAGPARAQTVPALPPAPPADPSPRPALREAWVPAESLAPVLGLYPSAVALSRDQLFTLLRDAHADDPAGPDATNPPPERAVLRQARFEGWLVPGPDGADPQVRVEALLEVESLSDAWAEVPLGLPGIALGTAELDAGASAGLRRYGGRTDGAAILQLQGRGPHRLRLGFVLPVTTGPEGSSVALPRVEGVGEFILHLPAGARADSARGCAVQPEGAGIVARVALRHGGDSLPLLPLSDAISSFVEHAHLDTSKTVPADSAPDRLNWRTPPPAPATAGAVLQDGRVDAAIDESGVTIGQRVLVRAALGRLTGEVRIALPAGASAVRVEDAGLARWDVGADGLHVTPGQTGEAEDPFSLLDLKHDQPQATVVFDRDKVAALGLNLSQVGADLSTMLGGNYRAAAFTVVYQLPLNLDPKGTPGRIAVPWLEAAGAHRVTGAVAVLRGSGVVVQRIEPGAVAIPAEGGTFTPTEQAAPDFVAGFELADLPAAGAAPPVALTLEVRRATARFSVDADAQASFDLDGVRVQRRLTVHVEEGELFSARISLPPGETLLSLHPIRTGVVPDWHQQGSDVLLTWNTGLAEGSETVLDLAGRTDLAPPKPGAPVDFTFGAALVPGAERLTGYVALASTPGLRLATTGGEERLERRDGRTTPVQGSVAWFYRDNFRLALRVERRAAETEARFTGYALPLAGAVEIHAQIDYHFLYAGVEAVKIRVPRDSADAFFFTGEHIAERRLDGDVWTVRFQGEQSGDYALGVQATIPAPADKDDAQRFHFHLPAVAPLDTARWSGAWAVEANTDTEIRFATTGVSEADALHAPPLAGYQPRRRIIGVFEFLGGAADPGIDLDGVRHPAAAVAAAVVDRLDLETMASTSGVSRHRATVRARTAADGFFDLRLPEGASLWSLTLDGAPVKPVGGAGAPDEVRVELPGGRSPSQASTVVVVYETTGRPWKGAGWKTIPTPAFDPGVPVLQSHWTLRLPDGFDYKLPGPQAGAGLPDAAPGDLLVPRMAGALGRAAQWIFYLPKYLAMREVLGSSGIADPRAVRTALPTWMADRLEQPRTEVPIIDLPAVKNVTTHAIMATPAPPPATAEEPDMAAPNDSADAKHGPQFIARVQQVRDLLKEADGFIANTRYDLAFKRYEQVLALDPSNDAARKGEERVDAARRINRPGYDATRGHQIWDVNHNWELSTKPSDESSQAVMNRKLQRIIIPHVEFRSTTLADAIEFLRQESARLDTESPPDDRGVNIFLELPPASPPITTGPAIPNLPASTEPPVSVTTERTRLSLTLNHIPLLEVLRYVAQQVNLKVRVDVYAVSLVPLTENTEAMVTREISVPPGIFHQTPKLFSGGGTTGVGTTTFDRGGAEDYLKSLGVQFPPGASATYLPATGKLVIRNTQENIDLADAAAEATNKPSPASTLTLLDGRKIAPGVAGLLPLQLDLPQNGRPYEFAGGGAPGALEFHYADWAAAARWRWVWLTLGALGFLLLAAGWAHPWRRTLYAVLILTFFPLIVASSATVPCNALLAGWLWALAGWVVTRLLLRRRRLAPVLLVCAAALLPGRADAEPPPTPTPAPTPELVIVPYDATRPVAGQTPERYYLPYDRFLLLWDAAKRHRRPPAPEPPPGSDRYLLSAARYDARLDGDTLAVDATLDLQTFGEGWTGVPLHFEQDRVGTVTLDGTPAALGADGALWVGTPGAHRVGVALRLPAKVLAAGTRLAWTVPPTTAALVTLLVTRADLRAEIHGGAPGGGEVEEVTPQGRRLSASVGGASSVALTFHDAPAPTPASAQPALARVDARLFAGPREESVWSAVDFSFPGGTQDHFTVSLDRSLTLTGLDALDIRQWHLDATGGDRQTLEVTLNAPAHDGYRLSLTADRPLAALPATRRAFPLVSAQAARVEQTAALFTEGAVSLTLPDGPPPGARRVDYPSPGRGRLFAAFAGDGTVAPVYSVRAADGNRAAHIDYLYQVGRGKIELAASVRLVPGEDGAPLTAADLRLPPGFTVQTVAGGAVRQWWRDGDVLSLRFRPADGRPEVPFLVYLVRQFDRAPDRFPLQGLVAVGFTETDGQTVVAADRSVKVSLTLPAGARSQALSEIPADTAASEFQVKAPLERQRAFRYRGAEFDVSVALENQPARWRAQWVTRATVRARAVRSRLLAALRQPPARVRDRRADAGGGGVHDCADLRPPGRDRWRQPRCRHRHRPVDRPRARARRRRARRRDLRARRSTPTDARPRALRGGRGPCVVLAAAAGESQTGLGYRTSRDRKRQLRWRRMPHAPHRSPSPPARCSSPTTAASWRSSRSNSPAASLRPDARRWSSASGKRAMSDLCPSTSGTSTPPRPPRYGGPRKKPPSTEHRWRRRRGSGHRAWRSRRHRRGRGSSRSPSTVKQA